MSLPNLVHSPAMTTAPTLTADHILALDDDAFEEVVADLWRPEEENDTLLDLVLSQRELAERWGDHLQLEVDDVIRQLDEAEGRDDPDTEEWRRRAFGAKLHMQDCLRLVKRARMKFERDERKGRAFQESLARAKAAETAVKAGQDRNEYLIALLEGVVAVLPANQSLRMRLDAFKRAVGHPS